MDKIEFPEHFKKLASQIGAGIALQKVAPQMLNFRNKYDFRFTHYDSGEVKIDKVCGYLGIKRPDETESFTNWKRLYFSGDKTNIDLAKTLVDGLCFSWKRIALNVIDFDLRLNASHDMLDAFRYSLYAFSQSKEKITDILTVHPS